MRLVVLSPLAHFCAKLWMRYARKFWYEITVFCIHSSRSLIGLSSAIVEYTNERVLAYEIGIILGSLIRAETTSRSVQSQIWEIQKILHFGIFNQL